MLLLILAGLLFYANSLGNNFVYDDLVIIRDNQRLDDLRNLKSLFTRDYFDVSGERSYRPAATALAFLDVAAGGRKPLVFHATSVAIHILNGIFIFLILLSLTGRRPMSALAALFFLLHPIQTEAVNGASFIEDPLSALFFLAALAAYLKYRAARRPGAFYALSAALYLLAMLAKEGAAMLPFAIILVEWSFRGESRFAAALKTRWKALAGYAAVACFYAVVRFILFANKQAGAAPEYPGGDLIHTIPMAAAAFLKYTSMFFYPQGLSVEHCFFSSVEYSGIYAVAAAVVIAAIIIFSVLIRRKDAAASFGALFFLLNLAPVSNILPFGALMAERYVYLASIGLCVFTVALLMPRSGKGGAEGRRQEKWNVIFVVCFTLIYGMFTVQRNFAWRDDLYIWRSALKVCPASSRAHTNYARRLLELTNDPAEIREAISHLEAAAQQDPDHYEALLALGTAYWRIGRPRLSESAYLEAYRVHPTNDVRYNIALLYNQIGAPRKALGYLKEIVVTQPKWIAARYLLGNTYLKTGEPDKARVEYLYVLSIEPGHVEARGNLGVIALESGDWRAAESCLRGILRKHPDNKYALENLKKAVEMKKQAGKMR